MSEPIKPALTAEGWRMFGGDAIESAENFIHQMHADETAEEIAEHMHSVAALALYGQPFGFTHEDVEDLRRLSNVKATGAVGDGITDDTPAFQRVFRIANLADRIAALLPEKK